MSPVRIDAGASTLVVDCADGNLLLTYLGERLPADLDLDELGRFAAALTPFGELDRRLHPQLFPTADGVATQRPALRLRHGNRRTDVSLRVTELAQLGEQLHASLEDSRAGVRLELAIDADASGVFRWQITLANSGSEYCSIDDLASLSLPLPPGCAELQRYGGFWANELQPSREQLHQSTLSIESLRGRSSHQSSPALLIGSAGFSDERGLCVLAALEWSGNHRLSISPAPAGGQQLLAGCALDGDHIEVAPGGSSAAPAALLAFSGTGINGLRRQTRRYWLARKQAEGASLQRPVHFNSWEASYFDHDCESTLRLLEMAAELGAERFVLDDGWMQGRTRSGVGLGDWLPCPTRYPDGLAPIAKRAAELGLGFGLWVEPEMVTPDSALAREHPDWIVGAGNAHTVTGRDQYLLDITRSAVRDYIHARLVALLEAAEPGYLKWDMNRDLADLGKLSATAFTNAWYELLQRLRRAFPQIQIEACAAGGARADCGALAHADRIWPSDSMDPLQRFQLFRALSPILPANWLGAHVGAARSATSGAALPLSTRCAVALLGHPGMELDPAALTRDERGQLQHWVTLYKTERAWLATADICYLDDPAPGTEVVMLYARGGGDDEGRSDRGDEAEDEQALLLIVQSAYPQTGQPPICRLPTLTGSARYSLELLNPDDCDFAQQHPDWQSGGRHEVSGATLVHGGLRLPFLRYGHCALLRLRKLINTPQS